MTTTDRINILNALEETKQQLPEQIYKTAIESLAKFVPEEEKDVEAEELARLLAAEEEEEAKVFFSELKKYRVSFNLEIPVPHIPPKDDEDCKGECGANHCEVDLCFRKERIHHMFYLHPFLVEFLNLYDQETIINFGCPHGNLDSMSVTIDNTYKIAPFPVRPGYIPPRVNLKSRDWLWRVKERRGLGQLISQQYKETIWAVMDHQTQGCKYYIYPGCTNNDHNIPRERSFYTRISLHKIEMSSTLTTSMQTQFVRTQFVASE